MAVHKYKKMLEGAQKLIKKLRKENETKSVLIGRCLHRGRIVDEVYDKVESLERQVTNLTNAKQTVEAKYSELEKSVQVFDVDTKGLD